MEKKWLQEFIKTVGEFKKNPSLSHGEKIKVFRKCLMTVLYLGSENKLSPSMIRMASSEPLIDLLYEEEPTLFQINLGIKSRWFKALKEIGKDKQIKKYVLCDILGINDNGKDLNSQVFYYYYSKVNELEKDLLILNLYSEYNGLSILFDILDYDLVTRIEKLELTKELNIFLIERFLAIKDELDYETYESYFASINNYLQDELFSSNTKDTSLSLTNTNITSIMDKITDSKILDENFIEIMLTRDSFNLLFYNFSSLFKVSSIKLFKVLEFVINELYCYDFDSIKDLHIFSYIHEEILQLKEPWYLAKLFLEKTELTDAEIDFKERFLNLVKSSTIHYFRKYRGKAYYYDENLSILKRYNIISYDELDEMGLNFTKPETYNAMNYDLSSTFRELRNNEVYEKAMLNAFTEVINSSVILDSLLIKFLSYRFKSINFSLIDAIINSQIYNIEYSDITNDYRNLVSESIDEVLNEILDNKDNLEVLKDKYPLTINNYKGDKDEFLKDIIKKAVYVNIKVERYFCYELFKKISKYKGYGKLILEESIEQSSKNKSISIRSCIAGSQRRKKQHGYSAEDFIRNLVEYLPDVDNLTIEAINDLGRRTVKDVINDLDLERKKLISTKIILLNPEDVNYFLSYKTRQIKDIKSLATLLN